MLYKVYGTDEISSILSSAAGGYYNRMALLPERDTGSTLSSDPEPFKLSHMDVRGESYGGNNPVYHLKVSAPTLQQLPLYSSTTTRASGSRGETSIAVFDCSPGVCHITINSYYDYGNPKQRDWFLETYRIDFDVEGNWKCVRFTHNYLNGIELNRSYSGKFRAVREVSGSDRTPNWLYYASLVNEQIAREGKVNWYKLYSQALDGIQMDTNMLENTKDALELITALAHPLRSLNDLIETFFFPKKGGKRYDRWISTWVGLDGDFGSYDSFVRRISDAYIPDSDFATRFKQFGNWWMTYRYAFSTTLQDVTELLRYMQQQPAEFARDLWDYSSLLHTYRSGETIGSTSYHFQIQLSRKDYRSNSMTMAQLGGFFDAATINLRRYGFYPTMANLWDLVPMSFVIDWFVPFGTWCSEHADADWVSSYFRVSSCVRSSKTQIQVNDMTITSYTRTPLKYPPSFEYYDDGPSSGGTVIKRVIDGVVMLSKGR